MKLILAVLCVVFISGCQRISYGDVEYWRLGSFEARNVLIETTIDANNVKTIHAEIGSTKSDIGQTIKSLIETGIEIGKAAK